MHTSDSIRRMSSRVVAISVCAAFVICAMPLRASARQATPGTRGYAAATAGWNAIRDGRNQDAADAFAIALDAEPRDPSLHLGAGLAAFLLGRQTDAKYSLQRALELAPSLTAASLLLGDILYRGSDIAGAIQVYEAALKYAPGDKTLNERLASLKQEAAVHSDFFQASGTHFTVLFEGPADEALASRALEILEAGYWRVSTALALYPEGVITVVLYTQEQFRDVTRSPDWAAAAYDGRIRIPVRGAETNSQEFERVLVHEFTHALIHSVAPRGVPTWLHEGLAVMFEPDGAAWSEGELAQFKGRLPLAALGGSFSSFSTADARLAYAESAGVVHALFDAGGAAGVGAMLQDLARGETFAEAFERRMFMTYDDFAGSWVAMAR